MMKIFKSLEKILKTLFCKYSEILKTLSNRIKITREYTCHLTDDLTKISKIISGIGSVVATSMINKGFFR